MNRSFATVLSLLVLLQVYIGMRLLPSLGLGVLSTIAAVLALVLLTVLVPVGLMSASLRRRRWSDALAWAGLLSMGLFSSLLVATLTRDLLLLALRLAGPAGMPTPAFVQASALAVPLVALAVSVLGFVNARRLARVVRVDVPIAGLPPALQGYAIAQVSDIHVGPTIRRAYLEAIVERVNTLGADAIAITGDLVDGSVHRLAAHPAPLARLAAPDGVFFVTGNHED